MRTLLSFIAASAMSMVSVTAAAATYAVKVECNGYACNNLPLQAVCDYSYSKNPGAAQPLKPFSVECESPKTPGSGTGESCGSLAWCVHTSAITDNQRVGDYCDDTNGNDAIVMCTDQY